MQKAFLVGDIGGTKTRMALVQCQGDSVHVLHEQRYRSAEYVEFDSILADFTQRCPEYSVQQCALAIAGPVQGRTVRTTNLPWVIDADQLQRQFAWTHCALLNDLEATAYGIAALQPHDLCQLQAGDDQASGNVAVIAAGTGLGEAGMYWDGQRYHPYGTEGGHTSFSPGDGREMALLQYLLKHYDHVSWERVVSGMGLPVLLQFLSEYKQQPISDLLQQQMRDGDAAAAIAQAGLSGEDALCEEVLHWFIGLYGAECGNLALKTMSRGGVYIGGGIAPRLLPLMQSPSFMQAFLNKGRMRPLLEKMPVHIILNDGTALLGPAVYLSSLTQEES